MKEQDIVLNIERPEKAESHELAGNSHDSAVSRRKMRSTNR
jgi:hypothetical protein